MTWTGRLQEADGLFFDGEMVYWRQSGLPEGEKSQGGGQMATWSGIRHKLEQDYLAEALRGRIQYFATTYSGSPDHEGRAAIRLDGEEIVRGNYYNQWLKAAQLPRDEKYEQRMSQEHPFMDETALEWGLFDQRSFYQAFAEFENQSIEESLASENLLVRIMALLDRRVGKRRLRAMGASMQTEAPILKFFYTLRLEAEGICWNDPTE